MKKLLQISQQELLSGVGISSRFRGEVRDSIPYETYMKKHISF